MSGALHCCASGWLSRECGKFRPVALRGDGERPLFCTLQLSLEGHWRGAVDRAAARRVDSPVLGAMPALGGRIKVCTAPICGGDHAPGLWFAGRGRHSCRHTIFAARGVFLAPNSKDRLGLGQALVGTSPRPNRERSPKQSASGVSRTWPS